MESQNQFSTAINVEACTGPVLATSVSPIRYLGNDILVAFAAPALFVLIAGTVIGILDSAADIGCQIITGWR